MRFELDINPAKASAWRAAGYWQDRLVSDQVDGWAGKAPERLCFIDSRGTIDYATLQSASYRLADAFLQRGVKPGEVVAAQLPNWLEFAVLHVALVRIGCITCLITPMSREREVSAMLRTSQARWFFVPATYRDFDYVGLARQVRADQGLPLEIVVVGQPGSEEDGWNALMAAGFDSAAARSAIDALRPGYDEPAEIVFTSGTTSEPKGAIHTHNTLLAPQLAMARSLRLSEKTMLHMGSTVAHQTGFLNGIRLPLQVGGTCVLQDKWSGDAFAELVERHRIEVSNGSSTFLLDFLRSDAVGKRDLSSLRIFRCGGGPIPIGLVREAEARLPGLKALRGWGQTENGVVTLTGLDDPVTVRAETDGRVQPGMDIRVVDAGNQVLPDGQEGRLQCRGAFQSPSYANSAELMKQSSVDGWFDTGDLAVRDAQGCIRICGRSKDIIIRGGENIPVAYVENVLFEDPRVLEAAVVGMPDPRLGERACVFVICRPGQSLDLDRMRKFLAERGVAAPYWPERLEIVDSFPRTANGKVRKAALRQLLSSGAAA